MDQSALLLIICLLLGTILTAVGIYLLLVLHETRKTLQRANNILSKIEATANFFEEKIARPATSFGSIALIMKEGLDFFAEIRRTLKSRQERPNE